MLLYFTIQLCLSFKDQKPYCTNLFTPRLLIYSNGHGEPVLYWITLTQEYFTELCMFF